MYALGQESLIIIQHQNDLGDIVKVDSIQAKPETSTRIILDSILNSTRIRGYISSSLYDLKQTPKGIRRFRIELGKKLSVLELKIPTSEGLEEEWVESTLSRKRELLLNIDDLPDFLEKFQDSLSGTGVAFSEIKLQNIATYKDTLKADLKIRTGQNRFINKIEIRGVDNFPKNLLRYLQSKKLIYNKDNINFIENEVETSQIVTIDKPSQTLFKRDSTKIYLYLKKRNANTAEGLLGINSDQNQKTALNGFLKLKLSNILRSGEQISFNYQNNGNEITSLRAGISLPLVLFNSIGFNSSLQITRRDSTYQNQLIKIGSFYQPKLNTKLGITYSSIETNSLDSDQDNILRTGANVNFQTENSFRSFLIDEPSMFLDMNIGMFNREILGDSQNQFITDATLFKNWHLNSKNQVNNRINFFYLNTDNITLAESRQLGGIESIRGFQENIIDTSKYLTLMTEYRRKLSDTLYAYGLIDLGVFSGINSSELRNIYGIGAGIAILTQSGLFTLSLANGSFDQANFDLNSTIAHINMKINF